MTDKELLEKTSKRLRVIADDTQRITSGNISHNLTCLRGFALRAAESIERHLQEPVSEDLEKEIAFFAINAGTGDNTPTIGEIAHHFVEWQKKKQKPDDKVEPKFRIEAGKWYICISQFCNCIEGRIYKATSDSRIMNDFGTEYDMHSDAYKYFRLWTIQDAKEGDVLYLQKDGKEHIIIYKGVIKERFRTFVSAYCAYNGIVDAFCFADVSRYVDIAYRGIMPATKEQRDLLFQKMKEAGYEWDAGKKELKKIEQKLAWSEEDKDMIQALNTCINAAIKSGMNYISFDSKSILIGKVKNWLKSLKDRVQPKQKWSEEDEKMIESLTSQLYRISTNTRTDSTSPNYTFYNEINWLKSLRPQNRWKPSDYELEVLKLAAEKDGTCLMGLYEQLKKLKGE